MPLNSRQHRTLQRVYAVPTKPVAWRDIDSLLVALGARRVQRAGSRVAYVLPGGAIVSLHKPHPTPEAHRDIVRAVRDFLDNQGVRP